jgi:hypothetical protein
MSENKNLLLSADKNAKNNMETKERGMARFSFR